MGRSNTTEWSASDYRDERLYEDQRSHDELNVAASPAENAMMHTPPMLATAEPLQERSDTQSTADELNWPRVLIAENVMMHTPPMLATAEPLQERPAVPEPPMLNRPAVPEPPMLNRPLVPEPPIGLPRLLTAEEMDPRPPNISSPIWLVLTERALVQMQQDYARRLIQQRQEQEIRDIRELYEGVSSQEAFARMQMDWARGQVNERWQSQVNVVRTLRHGVLGIDANRIPASMPTTFLRPPHELDTLY